MLNANFEPETRQLIIYLLMISWAFLSLIYLGHLLSGPYFLTCFRYELHNAGHHVRRAT